MPDEGALKPIRSHRARRVHRSSGVVRQLSGEVIDISIKSSDRFTRLLPQHGRWRTRLRFGRMQNLEGAMERHADGAIRLSEGRFDLLPEGLDWSRVRPTPGIVPLLAG
jgi:hypothetical protein